jgi:hypothetical protein
MTGTIFLVLAGLVAFGFLTVVWRRRQMPALLRALLIIVAVAIVIYVGWILLTLFTAGSAVQK